jgi:hypothetical protein
MVSFSPVVTDADVESVRAYVTMRSQQSWKILQAAKK